jgi:hypothetical protein
MDNPRQRKLDRATDFARLFQLGSAAAVATLGAASFFNSRIRKSETGAPGNDKEQTPNSSTVVEHPTARRQS